MKKITIGGKEYTLKYSMRATLQNDCIKQITKILVEMDEENEDADGISTLVADVIPTVMESFYAGLVEHHGTHTYGDGSVPNKASSDELVLQLMEENADKPNSLYGDFFGIMQEIIECMEDDGFFKRIGLERMFQTANTTATATAEQKKSSTKTKKSENGAK